MELFQHPLLVSQYQSRTNENLRPKKPSMHHGNGRLQNHNSIPQQSVQQLRNSKSSVASRSQHSIERRHRSYNRRDSVSIHKTPEDPGGGNNNDSDRDIAISAEMYRKPPPPSSFRPAVGFVYDRHTDYDKYTATHFNTTHALYIQTKEVMLSSLFLNGGVAVVDTVLWRKRNYTTLAEDIIRCNNPIHSKDSDLVATSNPNSSHPVYDSALGDQGVFYLLLQNRVAYLPAKWNMRRLPMKTVHMLENNDVTGL